jgi:hypothetical protein
MQDGQLLEFHYYLADGSHAIDALRLNKLEAEAIDVFLYIAGQLGFDITLEATTATDGGYRQVWRFVKNPKNAAVTAILASTVVGGATVATSVLNSLVAAAAQIWVAPSRPDPELENLQRELLKRSIEEKELDIEKKRRELQDAPPRTPPSHEHEEEFRPTPHRPPLQLDVRVVARRSNYYRLLLGDPRVDGVGLSWSRDPEGRLVEQKFIPRKEFVSYIVPVEPSEPRIVSDAFVEIVAPVIRSTDAKWRGVFEGKAISFSMRDADFKSDILRKGVQFQSGDAMNCILRISFKINEVGEEVVSGYEVLGVTKLSNTAEVGTGAQRTTLKYQSKIAPKQLLLNFLTDESDLP